MSRAAEISRLLRPAALLPEAGRFWIRYVPRAWESPEQPWVHLAEGRLASARHHGATDTRLAAEDTVEWIRSETGGFGADYTFEATGNVTVMRQAVEAAREAWGLATMCGVAGKGETLDVVPRFLITGRRIAGSSFGGVKGRTQVPQLVDRWLAGEFDAASLILHRIALDDVNRGFELMERQDGIRSVLAFE